MNTQIKYWEKVWSNKDFVQIVGIILGLFVLLIFILSLIKPAPEYASLVLDMGWFAIIVTTIAIYLRKKKLSWEEFGFQKISFKWLAISFLLILFVIFVGAGLSKILSNVLGISSENATSVDFILSDKLWLNILNLKIGIAILIPFAEELFFRGLIFKFLRQEKSFVFSAVLSALIFSVFHLSLASMPFTIILGIATAFAFEKTKSIFYPFIIHMGVNSLAVSMVLFNLI